MRRLVRQKPPKDEVDRESVIRQRETTATKTQTAHAVNSVRVREDDEVRRRNHGGPSWEERRELALKKAREALAEIEELL